MFQLVDGLPISYMAEESVKKQTISGVKWTALEQFSTHAITFIIGVILARLLSPSDYGVIGVLSVFMAVSGSFIDSGFGQALIRKPDVKDIDCCTVFYFNVVVSIICYAILFCSSPLIASFFNMPILESVVKVYCLTLVIGAFEAVQTNRLTFNLKFKVLAKVNVLSTIVSGCIGVVLAYFGFGVWALVFQSVLSRLFHVGMTWVTTKWCPRFAFSIQSLKEMFGFGSKLLASSILWQVYSNLISILIGKFFSAKDLGFYNRGTSLAQLPENTLLGVIDRVTFPILAKLQNDTDRLIYIYRKYIKCTSMAIMFAMMLFASLARPIVFMLLTDKWADCIIYFQVFVLGVVFDHIQRLNLNLLKVTGNSGLMLKLEVYKRLISSIFIIASIPFGVIGICWSLAIYAQIALVFNTYYTGKLFGLGYITQMTDFMPYALMSCMACAPSLIITFSSIPYWLMILIGSVTSILIYWAMLVMKKDESYIEFVKPVIIKITQKK